jgi:hypothetical protein
MNERIARVKARTRVRAERRSCSSKEKGPLRISYYRRVEGSKSCLCRLADRELCSMKPEGTLERPSIEIRDASSSASNLRW